MQRPFFSFLKIKFLCALVLLITMSCSSHKDEIPNPMVLWYAQPASQWEEALPLGNGRLGAMVFGNPAKERIQLNEDSLWPANLGWEEPEGNKDDLENIRNILMQGKHAQADSLFVQKFSRKTVVRSHQTLGDLYLNFNHKQITEYKRTLDLSDATATINYRTEGYAVHQKIFVSEPGQAIVVHIRSDHPEGLNGTLALNRPLDEGEPTVTVTAKDQHLVMHGTVTQRKGSFDSKPQPILEGVAFEVKLQAQHEAGKIKSKKDTLHLSGVKELTLYIVANTSFYHEDYIKKNKAQLSALAQQSPTEIETQHRSAHQNYFNRVRFTLDSETNWNHLPTDQRLARVEKGASDLGLQELLFHYGRYLLISSSRPGTNPANLQGLWNPHINAPWNADYHMNINLQMNYWLANSTQLDELNTPLFDFLDRLLQNGKTTARKNFGLRGSFLPHATDLWAPTWLRAPTAYWGCSVGAGGWMVQHYWNHYEYTLDYEFLKQKAFPALEAIAQFYSDWLIEDPRDGTLVSAPSTSPENRFYNDQGEHVATTMGSAMDQQVIEEVFQNYLKATAVLNRETPLKTTIKNQLKKLRPGFVLGSDGRILEWDREYKEPEPGHRHMSHLYGFHPGNAISADKHPELFAAVRKTLDYRLAHGGAGTGWSRAWLINCAARLLDGEMAQEHIQLLFQKSMYPNLFDAHPPFQIDGNFGYTAGIAEMLVQSHESHMLRLLPALPKIWKNGKVKGLKARGNITVDLEWKNNQLKKATLLAAQDSSILVVIGEQRQTVELQKNIPYIWKAK